MSLSTQRVASIAVLGLAAGGLLWSEYSGGKGGPAHAGAAQQADILTQETPAPSKADEQQGYRVALAGMFREYATRHGINAEGIDDPFSSPQSWAPSTPSPRTQADLPEAKPHQVAMNLTAILDTPGGAVARVNGTILVAGRPTHLPGVGTAELIEIGEDRRSALIRTEQGLTRLSLQLLITPGGA